MHDAASRFRKAYWQAMSVLDVVRLQQWERSRVTLPQLRVLYQVRRTPGITTRELSDALGITVSTTSGLIIKLVDRSLLERGTLADDRRQVPLSLTDAGAELVGEMSDVGRPLLARVVEQLGPDREAITAALERLAAVARSVRAELPHADSTVADTPDAPPSPPTIAPSPRHQHQDDVTSLPDERPAPPNNHSGEPPPPASVRTASRQREPHVEQIAPGCQAPAHGGIT